MLVQTISPSPRRSPKTAAPRAGSTPDWVRVTLPMVQRIAAGFARRLPPSTSVDDLVGAGLVALVELQRRHPSMAVEELARLGAARARGAMIDELRQADPLSRRVRQRTRQIDHVTATFEARTGRAPSEQELALALGISRRATASAQRLARSITAVEEPAELDAATSTGTPTPEEAVHRGQRLARCRRAIGHLPERKRTVVDLYFRQERNLRQVGQELGVSEARASQILSGTVRELRHACASIFPPAA